MKESGLDPQFQKSRGNVAENDSLEPDEGEIIQENDPVLLQKKIEDLEKQIIVLEYAVQDRIDERDELTELIQQRESSLSWKLGQAYGRIFPRNSALTNGISKLLTRIIWISQKSRSITNDPGHEKKSELKNELTKILKDNQDNCRGIILYPPTVDWDFPLFERPHQLALALADLGYLVLFSTAWQRFDNVSGFHKIKDRCYVTDQYPLLVNELPRFYCLLLSTNITLPLSEVQKLKNKSVIIYDYLDEISEKITPGRPIDNLRRRNEYMLRNADIILATADSLYDHAFKKRGRDVFLNPNGVDYFHFHIKRNTHSLLSDIKPIIEKGHPVIGYFGAFASWVDYPLIKKLAAERPGYEIVLIGWDWDGLFKDQELEKYPNIHYLGVKKYSVLPQYAIWFDVSMIPFVKSKITRATSPVKLFEYMALGNPIVTTEMPECMKYQSVLIGRDHEEFIRKIDLALEYREDKEYIASLDKEARENTWTARAVVIDKIITSMDKKIKDDNPLRNTPEKTGR